MPLVPISTNALSWAVKESGITTRDLDSRLRVNRGTVEGWIHGHGQPNMTQFNRLKSALKRPAAIFFMDTPPLATESVVVTRFALGAPERSRSPAERLAIRDSWRVGRFVFGLFEDLGLKFEDVPQVSLDEDPEEVATKMRMDYLRVPIEEQLALRSSARAFRFWRGLIERKGILTFAYSLRENSARGFSIATDSSPIVSISTNWHPSVSVYTLIHQLGHIFTRTSSSCFEDTVTGPTTDPTERWCESFAASFLMPREVIQSLIRTHTSIDPISKATWLADQLSVNRRVALLRLIDIQEAEWEDFRHLEARFERNKRGGGGNAPTRTRAKTRKDTYGSCLAVVEEAYNKGLVDEADIRTYLGMYPEELS